MVDAQTRRAGICPARAPDVPLTALNSNASRHHMAGSYSVNAAQSIAKDELVMNRSSVRFRQAARPEAPFPPQGTGPSPSPGDRARVDGAGGNDEGARLRCRGLLRGWCGWGGAFQPWGLLQMRH
ncbi:hypothetical protein GCM10023258_29040 [Terrabacter aeriphilus]|uniref:Uncharacterized protein n=1 Tax=Terrabacter aeriphilus TaxID=515662 RepID=A0ABP9JHY8_9MICO